MYSESKIDFRHEKRRQENWRIKGIRIRLHGQEESTYCLKQEKLEK